MSKGKHLTLESRLVLEDALRKPGPNASAVARAIGVSPSTVTREVLSNRTVTERRRAKGSKPTTRCARYRGCQRSGDACEGCSTRLTTCKHCRTRCCIDHCPDYERRMCPQTLGWPFVCPPGCPKRAACGYPLCSYSAHAAQASYRARLVESRKGVDLEPGELAAMDALVAPLVKQGQSFEAIWATHGRELPVCVRSAYRYQAAGLLSATDVDLPRKPRMRKRRRKAEAAGRDRIDRAGRAYADFLALPLEDVARAVQGDSVEGLERNAHDVLTLHIVARKFQIFLYKEHASAEAVVTWLDVIERALGSPEAFEAAFGILLVDRGVEFDDWAGMERSCLAEGARRCRVFYCDARNSNQKAEAERNHEQLRRILPKGRSDFDLLSAYDVAVCCSHVNSYPVGGLCGFERLGGHLPKALLDELGLERVEPDDVVLRPDLMAHAVEL